MTEYRILHAGRIDSAGRRDAPILVGIRIAVGKSTKAVDLAMTDAEALEAAANLITAVRTRQRLTPHDGGA